MKKPNFFMVGYPKTGSRSIQNLLEQHPDIFMGIKEIGYFNKEKNKQKEKFYKNHKNFSKLKYEERDFNKREDYLELFKEAKDEKAVGDRTTSYIFSKLAAERIKKFNPNAKIIIILREPIQRLRSAYQQSLKSRWALDSFEKYLGLEENEKILPPGAYTPDYLEKSKYYKHIEQYLERFGKKNLLILFFDDFKKSNIETCKKIFKFLGVDISFTPKTIHKNKAKVVRTNLLKAIFDLPTVIYMRRKIKKIFPRKIWDFISKQYKKIIFKEKKIEVSSKIRKKLKRELKPIVQKTNRFLHKRNLIDEERDLIKEWEYES